MKKFSTILKIFIPAAIWLFKSIKRLYFRAKENVDFFIQISLEADGWAERGCTLDAKENLWTDDVKLCSEPGCNFENILHSQCVCCESDLQGDCARIAYKENFMKQCDGTYSFEQRGCYNMGKSNVDFLRKTQ